MTWQGRLLVATPLLVEDTFARTVVLLLQHTEDDGAYGVVLSRPSESPLAPLLPGWALLAPDPVVVFDGGPVSQETAVCLARLSAGAGPHPSYERVPGMPVLATLDLDVDAADPVQEVRVFSGYAGWSPGQLEGEVEAGAWWVVDALPGDPFVGRPELLWRQVLRRQGPPLALVSTYPDDPALN